MAGKVIGIGGIFFKSKSPENTSAWYANHLGITTDQWGASFVSRKVSNAASTSYLQWSPFKEDTDYFQPSDQEYMVNYRVEGLEELIADLKNKGVVICDEIQIFEYGKFVHILDGDGRKIELWEPIDTVFDEMYGDIGKLNHE